MALNRLAWIAQGFVGFCLIAAGAVQAQIVPDATLGAERSQVLPINATTEQIQGGALRGVNLFHSFSEFNVGTGRGVYFANPAGIANIFSRVTGQNLSNIDGTLGVLGTANLFLLNPNGILFGPNARLDIRGSFLASTASSFKFSDGSEFSATTPQAAPLLTVNLTPGLQYGANQPQATITNRGNLVTGQDLTLAAGNLDLQGQLQAGRDLNLQAQNIVQIRDTVANPFLGTAGRDLTIQGKQAIDILALSHPQTNIQSGRNLGLISNGVVSGDAHFTSGGAFQLRTLSGQPANFISLYDPIIYANGDVVFGNYTGAALKVAATGSIQAGNIRITTPDTSGAIPTTDPDYITLTTLPSVILRAGVASVPTLNLPQTAGDTNTTFTTGTVVGYPPGSIVFGWIDTSSRTGGNGGNIELTAKGDIANTGSFLGPSPYGPDVTLGSFSYLDSESSGAGGNIALTSIEGNILLRGGEAASYSSSPSGNAGQGGAITFTTTNGSISLTDSGSDSGSDSRLYSRSGSTGKGGAITFTATNGNISLTDSSLSSGSADEGGAITFTATNGNISLTDSSLSSDSASSSRSAGRGGAITFTATNGNISLTDSSLFSGSVSFLGSFSRSGKGGAITFTATNGNISLTDSSLFSGSSTSSGSADEGGAITFTATNGNISLTDSSSSSYSSSLKGNAGTGGAITFTATNGNISLTDSSSSSYSFSSSGSAGTGGDISLRAMERAIFGDGASGLNSFSVSETEGNSGKGGKVTLEAGSGISGLTITTVASGGQSGDAQIKGFGNLLIDSLNVQTAQTVNVCRFPPCRTASDVFNISLNGRSQAGNVTIDSTGDLTFLNSKIQSDTLGANPSGSITITSPGILSSTNSQITSNTSSSGNAGDIAINALIIRVTAQSEIRAETTAISSGRGGNITINAPTAIDLNRTADGNPVISVKTSGAGQAGSITLNTPQLTLSDAAEITATATQSATNQQGDGSITLNASTLYLAGVVGIFAETQGQAPAGTLTLKPYNGQSNLDITLTPQSKISASTSGTGNGGDLILTAPQAITISGPGKLAVETTSSGNAGDITVTTQQLTLKDGVELSASSSGSGTAGNINITADNFNLNQGARVSSTTADRGQAGNLTVNVKDNLILTGQGTGLFASTERGSTGAGGSIAIDPQLVLIQDGATIAVNSQGSGQGGNISIRGNKLQLNNRATISAETVSTQGGNITLDLKDPVILRRNSTISATAGTAQAGGDGGNITITAPFIIGVLQENSDITANAYSGNGGTITLNTNAIYGLKVQPQLTPFSDITASSQLGINGTITLNTLNLDPSQGLTELPTNFDDQSQRIQPACIASKQGKAGQFVSVGRGGLPADPADPLTTDALLTADGRTVDPGTNPVSKTAANSALQRPSIDSPPTEIMEAIGWYVKPDGTVILSANAPAVSHHTPLTHTISCNDLLQPSR